MRLYLELARRGYRRAAAYPAATAAGLFTNVFFGFLIAYVLLAVFEQRDEVGGYDARETVTYVWLTQGLMSVVGSFGSTWRELALRVRSGDIALDLQRPVDLQSSLLAQDLGRAGYSAVFRAVPPFFVGALLFDVILPGDPLRLVAFAASVLLAVVVSFGVRFLVNLTAFWLLDYRGPMTLAMVLSHLLSGLVIPLAFFPGALSTIARATPFASMLQLPIDIFVGEAAGAEVLAVLAIQALWACVLFALGRAVFALATRKLVVQGG